MTKSEKQSIYESTLRDYLAMFAEMEPKHRAVWFFVAEESSLLSFPIGPGQTLQEARAVHAVRLTAMADALAAQQPWEGGKALIEDLLELSRLHSL
ncbi:MULTISPECIES: hypothetical protein [unclassified Variovorax]|uniref:hypothetical protein n=1 Tax=unclassified Variovorax TaxID=663243 RepID=UPI003F473B11